MPEDLIAKTAQYIEKQFRDESSGHDWWHIYRVWQLSKRIARKEGADYQICQLGALLHDIADFKFHGGDITAQLVLKQRESGWLSRVQMSKPKTQSAT